NVMISIDKAETGQPEVTFNRKLARGYKKMLNELRDTTDIEQPVNLQNLMDFDDLFVSREQDEETRQKVWRLTKEATIKAAESLLNKRRKEGSQVIAALRNRVDHIGDMLAKVQAKTDRRAQKTEEELLERIKALVDSDKIV